MHVREDQLESLALSFTSSNEIHRVSIINITNKISHNVTSPRSSCCTTAPSTRLSMADLASRELQYCVLLEHATTFTH